MAERQTHLMESPAYREKAREDHSKLKDLFEALKQEQRDRDARARMSAEEKIRLDQQRRHR